MKNIVVLISGNGSNLQAMIDACESGIIKDARISAVLSNKADAYGLERARQAGIDALHLSAADFADRAAFDQAMAERIDRYQPDLVVLAGFMRILSGEFVGRYQGRMINVHPSLLPKYTGLNTHQRAIDAGDSEHGTSVHFVTEELDGGPVILQAKVPIFAGDSADEVLARVQEQEHRIYPMVASWCLQGRVAMTAGQAVFDGGTLPVTGYATDE
ncbi:phosphoribosylglycinamide formyltransferase [Photobacterium satsumensis]|uniref:phosphoribosylglycinamide formyltransferase n=1 Tax=Photobacterium satsumensis TaxID=2910239 RepID=UPI003D130DD7